MKNLSLIASALAMLGLTACEKGLVDGVADVAPAGQAANSMLQVRTRSGGSAGGEATASPRGAVCRADWSNSPPSASPPSSTPTTVCPTVSV